jgi:hypothetical protein
MYLRTYVCIVWFPCALLASEASVLSVCIFIDWLAGKTGRSGLVPRSGYSFLVERMSSSRPSRTSFHFRQRTTRSPAVFVAKKTIRGSLDALGNAFYLHRNFVLVLRFCFLKFLGVDKYCCCIARFRSSRKSGPPIPPNSR